MTEEKPNPNFYNDLDAFVQAYVQWYEFVEGELAPDSVYEEADELFRDAHD